MTVEIICEGFDNALVRWPWDCRLPVAGDNLFYMAPRGEEDIGVLVTVRKVTLTITPGVMSPDRIDAKVHCDFPGEVAW